MQQPFASHPVMVHRLAKVVLAPRKPNQTSMERYWETQQINMQQPRTKRRLESVSAPEEDPDPPLKLAKPLQLAAPVAPVEPASPVVVIIDDSDADDAASIILVAD
jgi:hypothetical protein